MFLHMSVILFMGGGGGGGGIPACIAGGIQACLAAGLRGGVASQHALQQVFRGVSRPTPRVGGGSPGPHWCVCVFVCVSQHALRQTPSHGRLLLRALRILLECILVIF